MRVHFVPIVTERHTLDNRETNQALHPTKPPEIWHLNRKEKKHGKAKAQRQGNPSSRTLGNQ